MRTKRRKVREIPPYERRERERKIALFDELPERENWQLQQERVKEWREKAGAKRGRRRARQLNASAIAAGIGIGCAVTGLAAAAAFGWSQTAGVLMAAGAAWLVVSVFSYRRAA